MPQVDLEALVSVCGGGGGDRKIACETLADDVADSAGAGAVVEVDVPPDFPPESFWLSKDAEFDWFDRNAFLERKESTKGNSNSTNLNPSLNPSHSVSNSQRFGKNLKSKATIIGLPKTQKATFVDSKRRNCKPPNIRLFPKRSDSVGKAPVTEPSSPKVSCIGRVRSKRCRSRRNSSAQAAAATEPEKTASQRRTGKGQKTGLVSKITSFFRSEGRRRRKSKKSSVKDGFSEDSVPRRSNVTVKPVNTEPAAPGDPPGLGSMTRFASGRRSDGWGGGEDSDVSGRNSLDLGRRGV